MDWLLSPFTTTPALSSWGQLGAAVRSLPCRSLGLAPKMAALVGPDYLEKPSRGRKGRGTPGWLTQAKEGGRRGSTSVFRAGRGQRWAEQQTVRAG